MTNTYRHTQRGYISMAAAGTGLLLTLGRMMRGGSKRKLLPAALVLGGAGVVFSKLTVEISGGRLRSFFGANLPARTADLGDIASVEVVRNPWYYGWGVRYTPHGWLYNVSGLDAVEVRLTSGEQFRLGTDEPERLREAILQAGGLTG